MCDVFARNANAITQMGGELKEDKHPHNVQLHTWDMVSNPFNRSQRGTDKLEIIQRYTE